MLSNATRVTNIRHDVLKGDATFPPSFSITAESRSLHRTTHDSGAIFRDVFVTSYER